MMTNIANADIVQNEQDNADFVSTPKTPVKIQIWTTDGNIVKADILGDWAKEVNGEVISTYVKGDSPIETRVDSEKNLHIEIARPAQSYQVDYLITSFDMIYANRDKCLTFRPDANTIQSNVSSVVTRDYAKFETLVDGKYTIYQVNSANEWSSTVLDTTKVLECTPNVTSFADIAKAEYAYVKDSDGLVFTLREKDDSQIVFDNFDSQTRHQWIVTSDNEWLDVNTPLCDNKMDKNPASIDVYNDKGRIQLTEDGALTLWGQSLNGNVPYESMKQLTANLTTDDNSPSLLFAPKGGTEFLSQSKLTWSFFQMFFSDWTLSDGPIKTVLSKNNMQVMNEANVTFDTLLSAYNSTSLIVIRQTGTGNMLFPWKYDSSSKTFTYMGLVRYSSAVQCLVFTYGENNTLTFVDNYTLNDKYISGDDSVTVRQSGLNQYSILLNAETLEVEEQ